MPAKSKKRSSFLSKLTSWGLRVKILSIFMIVIGGLVLFFGIVSYSRLSGYIIADFRDDQHELLTIQRSIIKNFLDNVAHEAIFLSRLSSLNDYIENPNNNILLEDLENDFYSFSQDKKIYYQVRYLDETGKEVVRVENNKETAYLVKRENLQDKSDRYYFKEASQMAKEQIYVSPLDLNVERGEIENRGSEEDPEYVPVIRYATPVYTNDLQFKGVVVTNIYADVFLDEVKRTDTEEKNTYLINEKGYFLSHPDESKEWGFMLDNNYTIFDEIEKEEAEKIFTENQQKDFYSENINSLVSFEQIEINGADRSWYLLSVVKRPIVLQTIYSIVGDILLIALPAGVISISIVLIAVGYMVVRPLNELDHASKQIAKGDFEHKIPVTSKDEIGTLKRTFNTMIEELNKAQQNIEKTVEERTKELERTNEAMVGRELRMKELKEEIEKLKKKK